MFCGSSWGSVPSLDANGESSTGSVWNELPEIPKDALADDINTEHYETTSGSSYLMVQPVLQEKTDVLCLMLLPETENILEFLEETEWDLTAAQDKITIAIIQADWDDTEEADRYYDEVYQDLADSQITESTTVFLTGYENAARRCAYCTETRRVIITAVREIEIKWRKRLEINSVIYYTVFRKDIGPVSRSGNPGHFIGTAFYLTAA